MGKRKREEMAAIDLRGTRILDNSHDLWEN